MADSIRVWQPMLRGEYSHALTVPFVGLVMNQQRFLDALEARLQKQIEEDPEETQRLLSGSVEYSPNLYQIAMSSRSRDWPRLIVMCDQMQILLGKLDLDHGRSLRLRPDDLPSLAETLEVI